MRMTYWLGSAAGKPVTDHSGQIDPLHYVLKQGANAHKITKYAAQNRRRWAVMGCLTWPFPVPACGDS